jgi:uncharacterized membrane protein YidH (DUF202 family)
MFYSTANDNELSGGSAESTDKLMLTRSIVVFGIIINMLNNNCNQLLQQPMGVTFQRGKKITTNEVQMLCSMGLATSESTTERFMKTMTMMNDAWILAHLALLMVQCCVFIICFDNIDWIGRGITASLHKMLVLCTIHPPIPKDAVLIKTSPLSMIESTAYRLTDAGLEAVKKLQQKRCNEVMVTESDEAQNVRVQRLVDGAKHVMTNNERDHRKVKRLGRPVKMESVIDLTNDDDDDNDDDYNEDDDDDESDRHPKQQRCVTRSMDKLLTCEFRSPELATNMVVVEKTFDLKDPYKLDRRTWESAPINVFKGEMVNLIVQCEDRNIAYVENSSGDRGWIPNDSITGDDAHSQPAHFITPKKFRKPPFQR